MHVGLIAAIVLAFFSIFRIPKKANYTLTLIFLIFYSFAAGSNPPILRAVIMFAVIVIGYLIERDADTLNSLTLAAFLLLLWNPKELFNPSFQLSFVSVGSIIIFAPRIDKFFGVDQIKRDSRARKALVYLYKGISVSIAAWIGSWPFILSYFNIISPVSIAANLIIIPLLFVLMAASFVFIAASSLSVFLGALTVNIVSGAERILFAINHFFSMLPLSHFRVATPSIPILGLYYAMLLCMIGPPEMRLVRAKIKRVSVLFIILVCVNILVWKGDIDAGRRILKMTFLDVGKGDCLFIELPGSGTILIDGGPGGEEGRYDTGRAVIAPYLWAKGVRNIDTIVVTHFHSDHYGGLLYILKNFKVGSVVDNGATLKNSPLYSEYKKILQTKRIRHFTVRETGEINTSSGVKFFVLNPPRNSDLENLLADENDNSVVLKLVYKNFSSLFCGDATSKTMSRLFLYDSFLKSDVIKVPHHGGRLGDEEIASAFFERVAPAVCVTSRGETGNGKLRYAEKANYMAGLNSKFYDTYKDGAVTISADGKSPAVCKTYANKN